MKKLSRLASLLLAGLMAVSAFSGCSDDGKKSSTSTASNANSSSAVSSATDSSSSVGGTTDLDTSKEVELKMYVISDRPAKQDELDENINSYFKEKLNTTLKTNWIGWAEYANKYPLLFSSGEKFDMAYSATWLNFASLAQKGAFMNLDELWPTYAPNNYAKQSDDAKFQATVNGHYYCVPTLLATYSAYGPMYRTDFLEDGDWDGKMENLADLEKYLAIAKEKTTMEPLNIYQSGSEVDDMFMLENGMYAIKGASNDFLWIDPTEESPKMFTFYEYEKTPEFLQMMKRWNEAEYFTKSALSDTDSAKTKNGKAAATIHNTDAYAGLHIEKPDWGFKYANFTSDLSYMSFTQDAMVISNTSENPERALVFYDLITTDQEAYNTFTYGIEGVSYKLVGDEVEALNSTDYPFSPMWAARTTEFHLPTLGSPDDLQELRAGFDSQIKDGEKAQKFRSFAIDTSSIETEYAACQNVHQQYWWPLELGYTDAEAGLAEYQQKMEAAGIEKVRETLQSQLEDYLKLIAE